jgi:hypothetical protein
LRPRHVDVLKEMGDSASVEDFRRILAEIQAEHFADWTDEELISTRDEAGTFCQLVRKRLNAPRLTRPFIVRSLEGLRRKKPKAKATQG